MAGLPDQVVRDPAGLIESPTRRSTAPKPPGETAASSRKVHPEVCLVLKVSFLEKRDAKGALPPVAPGHSVSFLLSHRVSQILIVGGNETVDAATAILGYARVSTVVRTSMRSFLPRSLPRGPNPARSSPTKSPVQWNTFPSGQPGGLAALTPAKATLWSPPDRLGRSCRGSNLAPSQILASAEFYCAPYVKA